MGCRMAFAPFCEGWIQPGSCGTCRRRYMHSSMAEVFDIEIALPAKVWVIIVTFRRLQQRHMARCPRFWAHCPRPRWHCLLTITCSFLACVSSRNTWLDPVSDHARYNALAFAKVFTGLLPVCE